MDKSVEVRVLYTQNCPNVAPTIDLIERVGKDIGVDVMFDKVLVASQEEAVNLRFFGSPTLQIYGIDVEPAARRSMSFGLG